MDHSTSRGATSYQEHEKLRELHEEEERMKLRILQADAGLIGGKDLLVTAERMDWMYLNPAQAKQEKGDEEYLLGKSVTDEREEMRKRLGAGTSATDSLFLASLTAQNDDTLRRLREDPLFTIRQAEHERRHKELTRFKILKSIAEVKEAKAKEEKKRQKLLRKQKKRNDRRDSSSSDNDSQNSSKKKKKKTLAQRETHYRSYNSHTRSPEVYRNHETYDKKKNTTHSRLQSSPDSYYTSRGRSSTRYYKDRNHVSYDRDQSRNVSQNEYYSTRSSYNDRRKYSTEDFDKDKHDKFKDNYYSRHLNDKRKEIFDDRKRKRNANFFDSQNHYDSADNSNVSSTSNNYRHYHQRSSGMRGGHTSYYHEEEKARKNSNYIDTKRPCSYDHSKCSSLPKKEYPSIETRNKNFNKPVRRRRGGLSSSLSSYSDCSKDHHSPYKNNNDDFIPSSSHYRSSVNENKTNRKNRRSTERSSPPLSSTISHRHHHQKPDIDQHDHNIENRTNDKNYNKNTFNHNNSKPNHKKDPRLHDASLLSQSSSFSSTSNCSLKSNESLREKKQLHASLLDDKDKTVSGHLQLPSTLPKGPVLTREWRERLQQQQHNDNLKNYNNNCPDNISHRSSSSSSSSSSDEVAPPSDMGESIRKLREDKGLMPMLFKSVRGQQRRQTYQQGSNKPSSSVQRDIVKSCTTDSENKSQRLQEMEELGKLHEEEKNRKLGHLAEVEQLQEKLEAQKRQRAQQENNETNFIHKARHEAYVGNAVSLEERIKRYAARRRKDYLDKDTLND